MGTLLMVGVVSAGSTFVDACKALVYRGEAMRNLKLFFSPLFLVIFCFGLAVPVSAHADKREKRVVAKTKRAMKKFKRKQYRDAKKLLRRAIVIGGERESAASAVAVAYVNLGVVYYKGFNSVEKTESSFAKAVTFDPNVVLDDRYSDPELKTMLETARSAAGGGEGGGVCDIEGVVMEPVTRPVVGTATDVVVRVGASLKATSVNLYIHSEGDVAFSKLSLSKQGDCEFVGTIPASDVRGNYILYYVAALNEAGNYVGSVGSSEFPQTVRVVSGGGSVEEKKEPSAPVVKTAQSLEDKKMASPVASPFFASLAIGSGGGHIQGPTEKAGGIVSCCFGTAPIHLMPEFGYFLNPQTSVSAAFRMGFPVGANIEGHATFAPAGLLRIRYALDRSGDGIQVSGIVGGGIIRNVVTIEDGEDGMDVDTTAMGPLLLGTSLGYSVSVDDSIRILGELNTLAGLTMGVDGLGGCPDEDGCTRPKNGFQMDVNLAVVFSL